LEAVNGEIKANTPHIVPPERTWKVQTERCKDERQNR